MPSYVSGASKHWSKKQGKWITKKNEAAFDYSSVDEDSAAFLISFFRAYPDYMADVFRSPNAEYKLELPQRVMMRAMARYRNVYIQGCRGLTKTYVLILTKMIIGVLWSGEICRYSAPNQKQSATLAAQAFHQIEKDYPDIAAMWQVKNDRTDMFKITTIYGSEISMYAPRGSNASSVIGEEIAAEAPEAFDLDDFEKNVLPTVRIVRQVNKHKDKTHINLQHTYITNASSKANRAFTVHRYAALKDMLFGDRHEGYVMDIPWEVAVICNIRDIAYIKEQKAKLSPENFLREMCARNTGAGDNPMISDETLAKSRTLMTMEDCHSGDRNAIYVIGVDYSFVDSAKNAKCGIAVWKLTRFKSKERRDKYRKQLVYIDSYSPPKTAYLQMVRVKDIWRRYTLDGAQATYIAMDKRNGGALLIPEFMKPSDDGLPPLCCYKHVEYADMEQANALPIMYPISATAGGGRDNEGEMIRYAQVEFEQGNIELLTSSLTDGLEQYKRKHNIKDDFADSKIALPYRKTDELCQQIQNLTTAVTGFTTKEVRRTKGILRDEWSACKYGLRFIAILEQELAKETYKVSNPWQKEFEKYKSGNYGNGNMTVKGQSNAVNSLLNKRKL